MDVANIAAGKIPDAPKQLDKAKLHKNQHQHQNGVSSSTGQNDLKKTTGAPSMFT